MSGSTKGRTTIRSFARRNTSSNHSAAAIAPAPLENRTIIVAQGIEFHNNCELTPRGWDIPNGIGNRPKGKKVPLSFTPQSDGSMVHVNSKQGVRFIIKVITTKDDFKAALEKPNAHVVYIGHARYGRGPCFGDESKGKSCNKPGENWSAGSNTTKYGLFRMGFPYLSVPITEILEHGYQARLVLATEKLPKKSRNEVHPELWPFLKRLQKKTVNDIIKHQEQLKVDVKAATSGYIGSMPENLDEVLKTDPNLFSGFIAGSPSGNTEFWCYHKTVSFRNNSFQLLYIPLEAGWKDTVAKPMDLGAINMKCRVFCHFGCSTFLHNYPILRTHKNWQLIKNQKNIAIDRFAYWTTRPAYGDIGHFWLYHILTYQKYNAFQSWQSSLKYALKHTNDDLASKRRKYRIK